jgi:hemerythrin-like domain-containing protein
MVRRHEALIPLTHDHHHVLAAVRNARQAVKSGDLRAAAQELMSVYANEMLNHFREEEELVFPLLVDAKGDIPSELATAMREHLVIHALTEEMRNKPSAETVDRLLQLIEGHVRLEEKTLFPMIERLRSSALEELTLKPRFRSPR